MQIKCIEWSLGWGPLIQMIKMNVFLVLTKEDSHCFSHYSANTSGLQLCASQEQNSSLTSQAAAAAAQYQL